MGFANTEELNGQDMPREKMLRYGPEKLSDSELLAIVLGTGTKEMNVLFLAETVINRFGQSGLPYATCADLSECSGLGPARACRTAAVFELGKRFFQNKKTNLYMKPEDVWEGMRDLRNSKKEHFVVFYLDSRNQEIKREIVSMGTVNLSLVHPREVFEPAVRNLASSIIIAHNHPSGHTAPSAHDVSTTKRLETAGKILGIKLLDHVIVGSEGFTSMREEGMLDNNGEEKANTSQDSNF
ncbi:MAG: DNA repair protein RadC [Elusimicrobiales bacterium]|nr:DNA repair protein RadC [Elusimicrobiales bacterium]